LLLSFYIHSVSTEEIVQQQMNHTIKQTTSGVPHNLARKLYKGVFYLTSEYMSKYNFIYASRARATIPAPVYIILTNAQKHCVQMSYTNFHQTGAILRFELPTVL
jgi:hypothetical protein